MPSLCLTVSIVFFFSMTNQTFLKVNWTTGNRCILRSQVVKNNEKYEDLGKRKYPLLKNLKSNGKA